MQETRSDREAARQKMQVSRISAWIPVGNVALIIFMLSVPCFCFGQGLSEDQCEQLGSLGASAVSNRAKGLTKQEMTAALPAPDQPLSMRDTPQYRLLLAMYEILDEVFDNEPLNQTAYMVYKTETCFQFNSNNKVPRPFQLVYPDLIACGELGDVNDIINCSMHVAGATDDEP